MKSKKVLLVLSSLLIVLGVGICFGASILAESDVEVRIERAGICNPLKPLKDKEIKTTEEEKAKLRDFWKSTNKDKAPKEDELIRTLIGDYKLFVGEDEILFNADVNYVSYKGRYVSISEEFMKYLSKFKVSTDEEID